jgi:hypothetical protein
MVSASRRRNQDSHMARPPRIELAGACYHLTPRGDRREAIYQDDEVYSLVLTP